MPFISYAQNYEDVILWRTLRDVENGFYVDVGAADPEEWSVTRAFYDRGWSGINLEPLDHYFVKLTQARPRDTNLQLAVGREAGLRVMHTIAGTGLSTLDPQVAAGHRAAGWQVHETVMPVLPLAKVIEDFGPPIIHFLKIDVEGAEGEVLEGLNLERVRPWIIIIEATEPFSTVSTREKWEHLITGCRYAFAYFDGLNCFYVANEVSDLKERLAVPPNVFDDFVRWPEWSNREKAETLSQELSWLQGKSQGERAQAANLRTALQAEQAQAANLRTALQEEQANVAALQAQLAVPSLDRALGRAFNKVRKMGDRVTGGGARALAARMLRRSKTLVVRHPRLGGLASLFLKPFPKLSARLNKMSLQPSVIVPAVEGSEVTVDLAPEHSRVVELSVSSQKQGSAIRFETNAEGVNFKNDTRTLFFNVRIISHDTTGLAGRLQLLDGFSDLEVDGKIPHAWAVAPRADLEVTHVPGDNGTVRYAFELSALSARSIRISRPPPGVVKSAPKATASLIPVSAQSVYRRLQAAMAENDRWRIKIDEDRPGPSRRAK